MQETGEPKYGPMTALDFHTSTNRKYYGAEYRQTGSDTAAGTPSAPVPQAAHQDVDVRAAARGGPSERGRL